MINAPIERLKNLVEESTPGPWCLWRGPLYVGGGEDICIGAGDTWLANMDHRVSMIPGERLSPGEWPGWQQVEETDILTINPVEIAREQETNAHLIALAPALGEAAALAEAVERLGVYGVKFVGQPDDMRGGMCNLGDFDSLSQSEWRDLSDALVVAQAALAAFIAAISTDEVEA